MTYRITVEKIEGETTTKLYEQSVEELDMRAVMAGVNKKPRRPRGSNAEPKPGRTQAPKP